MTQSTNETTKDSKQDSSNASANGVNNAADSVFAESATANSAGQTPSLEQTVVQLELQVAELRDRELKAQAELENFRRRIMRDVELQLKFAAMPLVKDLLEVADNLNRATDSATAATSTESIVAGVKMVQQQLGLVLSKHFCNPIPGVGHPFDPNVHQAIAQQPSAEHPAGTVVLETSTGYTMHDRVVRPSMVIVSTGPAA